MVLIWINIISGLLIILIFLLIAIFNHQENKIKLKQIKMIVFSSMLVSLAVILNTFGKYLINPALPSKIFEIKLGDCILVLIGFFCGGMLGFLSGIVADFLGLIFAATGTPNLFFTLTSILWCVVPFYLTALISKIYARNWTIYCYLPLTYGLTSLLITTIDPLILKYMYNFPALWPLYLPRFIKYPIDLVVNSFLVIVCYKAMIKNLSLQFQFQKKQDYYLSSNEKLRSNND